MYLFYGIDNYLMHKAVADFIKKQDFDNYHIINYYLDKENNDKTFLAIEQACQSINMFSEKKIIIINDYFNFLNIQRENWERFYLLIKNLQTNNEIIIKIFNTELESFLQNQVFKYYYIASYNTKQLKLWFKKQIEYYQIKIKNDNLINFNQFPKQISIIDNEIKKWQNFATEIPFEWIVNSFEKYYDITVIKLFEQLLVKNYPQFWILYCNYWKNTNFDKLQLILIFAEHLELIRNVKLAIANAWSQRKIVTNFKFDNNLQIAKIENCALSISKINSLLLKIHDIDYNLKNGKYNKLVVIDAFFLNICDIIL